MRLAKTNLVRFTFSVLFSVPGFCLSAGVDDERISNDFDLDQVAQSVVYLTVERSVGRSQNYVGVVISPSLILTSSEAVSGLSPKLSIQGDPATIIRDFDDKKMVLISYPRGGLQPATLAKSFGAEGREINFVYKNSDGASFRPATIVNLVSENTSRGGYFDASLAPALIDAAQAAVFNNCGELIGFFDKSIRSQVVTAKGLDEITAVVASAGRFTAAKHSCQSEAEKQEVREYISQKRAQEREAEAAKALDAAEKAALEQKQESAKALRDAQEKAKVEAAKAAEEVRQRTDKEKEKIEEELKQAEEDAALREAEAKEELEKVEKEQLLKEAEAREQIKQQRIQYFAGIGALVAVLLLFLFIRSRRKRAAEQSQSPNEFNETGIDLIIRGAGLSLKVPEEILGRERGATIGRSAADCDFVLDAPSISRSHLRVILRDGLLYAEDLGSANGTCINGKRLESGQLAALHNADDLELADSHFSVEVRAR